MQSSANSCVEVEKSTEQLSIAMGHSDRNTIQHYVGGVTGLDGQGIVHGLGQRLHLYRNATSMMTNRNLFAPRPPGSFLTEVSIKRLGPGTPSAPTAPKEPARVVSRMVLSVAQEKELSLRSRKRAYQKNCSNFLKGKGPAIRATAPNMPNKDREPSRYLLALLKFEPHRMAAIDRMFRKDELTATLSFAEVLEPLIGMASVERQRYVYKSAEPDEQSRCRDCGKDVTKYVNPSFLPRSLLTTSRLRLDRAHSHLLQCARRRRIKRGRESMSEYFEALRICLWNDCRHTFRGKTCGTYSCHVSEHLRNSKAHQCLWDGCAKVFRSHDDLAIHIWQAHNVPNEFTTYTRMHYCYEHDVWCCSHRAWDAHLQKKHLEELNDFCGLIRGGVVVAAANCSFCVGHNAPLSTRFAQFSDVFVLHKHIEEKHLAAARDPLICPHPLCKERLESKNEFWDHATTVHGVPRLGPRRSTGKRKANEDAVDETDWLMAPKRSTRGSPGIDAWAGSADAPAGA